MLNREDPVHNWSNTFVFFLIKANPTLNLRQCVIITALLELPNAKAAWNQDVIKPFTCPSGLGYESSPFLTQLAQINRNWTAFCLLKSIMSLNYHTVLVVVFTGSFYKTRHRKSKLISGSSPRVEKSHCRVQNLLRRRSKQNRPQYHLPGKLEPMGPAAPSNDTLFCSQVHFTA